MDSKYTYFVSFTSEKNGIISISESMTLTIGYKLIDSESVDSLARRIEDTICAISLSIDNFILLSETHEPEKSDNVKDFLTELDELFTKYDAQIENSPVYGELSVYVGNSECITVTNDIIDDDDIQSKLLEL